MTGYLYRGSPELERINAAIMADRAAGTSSSRGAGVAQEALRRFDLRSRDIPRSCPCRWHWSHKEDRWVVMGRHRSSCPWRGKVAIRR